MQNGKKPLTKCDIACMMVLRSGNVSLKIGGYLLKKNITLKDVAEKAGVGLGTASRVLNNHGRVSAETRAAVMEAMKALGYKPNNVARSLKRNATKKIGVIVTDISNPFYSDVVKGMEDRASRHGYSVLLSNMDHKYEKLDAIIALMDEEKVEGIIYAGMMIDESGMSLFKALDIPVVFVSMAILDKINPEDPFASINIDNEKAAYDATKYLLGLGHSDIAILAGYFHDLNAGLPRLLGYKRAMEEAGLSVREDRVFEGDFAFQSGYLNTKTLIGGGKLPTAIFAASDMMAMGAARAILESGLKIPEDISVIGFDGLDNGAYFYPAITTVEQPRYEYGNEGLNILIQMLNKTYAGPISCVMQYTIKERESCRNI